MTQELVPELHDIGKLVDWDAVRSIWPKCTEKQFQQHSHDLGEISQLGLPEPDTNTWLGIRFHHIGKRISLANPPAALRSSDLNTRKALWLLSAADHMAGSVSRSLRESFEEQELKYRLTGARRKGRRCLWRPSDSARSAEGLPVANESTFRELVDFLSSDPTWPAAKARYGEALRRVPEDKGFPRHVTSLLTHCELVGKFYRILERHSSLDPGKRALIYGGLQAGTVEEIERNWRFRFLRAHAHFPQRPARTRDLGVFHLLTDAMKRIADDPRLSDYLLLNTLDAMWLFLPLGMPVEDAVQPLLECGFSMDAEEANLALNSMDANVDRMRSQGASVEQTTAYRPDLPSEISPPICEICQMGAGTERDLDPESGIEEWLCPTCRSARAVAGQHPLSKLGTVWEQEDALVAWVRLRLDYETLKKRLEVLFADYVSSQVASKEDCQKILANLRTVALSVDFTNDYRRLLGEFAAGVEAHKNFSANVQVVTPGDPDLMVIRLTCGQDVVEIGRLFANKIGQTFPKCLEESPVKLGVSISNAKYPFFEHWRYLEKPRQGINIRIVGRSTPLELTVAQWNGIVSLGLAEQRASSALHRAAAIEARSDSKLLAEIELLDSLEKGSNLHRAILQGFSVSQLLAYHKLTNWGARA